MLCFDGWANLHPNEESFNHSSPLFLSSESYCVIRCLQLLIIEGVYVCVVYAWTRTQINEMKSRGICQGSPQPLSYLTAFNWFSIDGQTACFLRSQQEIMGRL